MTQAAMRTPLLRKLLHPIRARRVELVASSRTTALALTKRECRIESDTWLVNGVGGSHASKPRAAHFVKVINGITPKADEFWQLLVTRVGESASVPSDKVADSLWLNKGDRIVWRIVNTAECTHVRALESGK